MKAEELKRWWDWSGGPADAFGRANTLCSPGRQPSAIVKPFPKGGETSQYIWGTVKSSYYIRMYSRKGRKKLVGAEVKEMGSILLWKTSDFILKFNLSQTSVKAIANLSFLWQPHSIRTIISLFSFNKLYFYEKYFKGKLNNIINIIQRKTVSFAIKNR